jgi:PTH2 family peptidyl-tRNA hydrolase
MNADSAVFSASHSSTQCWLYFLAGSLLPSIAYYFLLRNNSKTSQVKTNIAPKQATSSQTEDDDADIDSDDDESEDAMNVATTGGASAHWGIAHAPYKMIFLVNMELSMGKGKIAAQCAHAAVGCFQRATKQCPAAVRSWNYSGCAKIALKCATQHEMEEIAANALSLDIPIYLVEDAGRTQIAAGSRTVLGLFGPNHVFEGVTDHLKLM